jgi:hypothetical protein
VTSQDGEIVGGGRRRPFEDEFGGVRVWLGGVDNRVKNVREGRQRQRRENGAARQTRGGQATYVCWVQLAASSVSFRHNTSVSQRLLVSFSSVQGTSEEREKAIANELGRPAT